jgi:hypothetical protein
MGMLWLRETKYGPGTHPVTMVIAEDGLKEDIHVVANADRTLFGRAVDVEIFEWENDLQSATFEAGRRAATRLPEKTHLMNVLHDFLISSFLKSKRETLIAPRSVTPLDAVDIRQVLLAVMTHPGYKGQIVKLTSSDRRIVALEGVSIVVKDLP